MIVMTFAFEIQNRVYDVLERFWTSNRSFFGDVTNQKNRNTAILSQRKKLVRDFPYLRNRSRRGFDRARKDSLNRIDDHSAGTESIDLVKYLFEVGFGKRVKVAGSDAEAIAAKLDLPLGFLAGDVEHDSARAAQTIRNLKQQRALADAWIAANQHERAGHDPAAENSIKLRHAGRKSRIVLR